MTAKLTYEIIMSLSENERALLFDMLEPQFEKYFVLSGESQSELVDNVNKFFEINHLLVKKLLKNQDVLKNLEKKIYSEEFDIKIMESVDKFINWLLVV